MTWGAKETSRSSIDLAHARFMRHLRVAKGFAMKTLTLIWADPFMLRKLLGQTLIGLIVPVLCSAQSSLPPKMQGQWTNSAGRGGTGTSTIELISAEGADSARVMVTINNANYPNKYGVCRFGSVEATATREGGSWNIPVSHPRCTAYLFTIHPVEGKQRFEGTWRNYPSPDVMPGGGPISFEW